MLLIIMLMPKYNRINDNIFDDISNFSCQHLPKCIEIISNTLRYTGDNFIQQTKS